VHTLPNLKLLAARYPIHAGLVLLTVAAVAVALLFDKSAILTALRPGESLTVQLTRDYKIKPYATVVKIAGTDVGVVQSVELSPPGSPAPAQMRLTLTNGTRALLGTEPSAEIRPTTVLGGAYYVQLYPGGDKGTADSATIPVVRTRLPVELDRLLSAIPLDAQRGLQGSLERLDATFAAGAGAPLDQLLADAPGTLRPTAAVADALRGINKDTDLASLVTNLDNTARVLSARPGQLRSILDSLTSDARVLGADAVPLDQTVAELPHTLTATRVGAQDLSGTLDKLTATARDARPTVRRLDPLLRRTAPTLAQLRPVLADLHPLLADAVPLLDHLAPTLRQGHDLLADLHGPVLDRINGPILGQFNDQWHGLAPKYPGGGGDGDTFYQELGYMVAHIDDAVSYQDATGHKIAFQLGAGSNSLEGTGATAKQLQNYLSRMFGPPLRPGPTPIGPLLPGGIALPDPGLSAPTVAVPDLGTGGHR
jgi:phospholipid/cholesterol/gamma-HCH transport system substrate-binding protein